MKNPLNALAIIGLILGAVLGMAGTFVPTADLRAIFWAIDGVGLIVATALLTLKYHRAQNDLVAAGFLIYCIGESVMLTGTATTLEASIPSFAAGTALWSAGLMLTSIPRTFPAWTRLAGIAASILFAITAAEIFWGSPITPLGSPLPHFAYPVLVLTFIGWITALIKEPRTP